MNDYSVEVRKYELRNHARVDFLANLQEIKELLELDHTAVAIWRWLTTENKIAMTYVTFAKHLRLWRKENSVEVPKNKDAPQEKAIVPSSVGKTRTALKFNSQAQLAGLIEDDEEENKKTPKEE